MSQRLFKDRRYFFQGIPLIIKVSFFTFVIGTVVWVILNNRQNQDIRQLFLDEMAEKLEQQAREDRLFFDHHTQSHHQAAKLILSQHRFQAYVFDETWLNKKKRTHYYRPAPWLPKSSVMRSFFRARYALLIDAQGQVREIYHYFPEELPPLLLQPNSLLQKLSHNQSYLTMIDDIPFVLAAQSLKNDEGSVRATLMLVSPIDDEFLMASMAGHHPEQIISLIGGQPRQIIASSRPDFLPTGTLVENLEKQYLIMGTSVFDYGSSDLEVEFASFINTDKAHHLAHHILKKGYEQRIILVVTLSGSFFILIVWIAYRIKKVTQNIVHFSQSRLGIQKDLIGDEIDKIAMSFQQLKNRIEMVIKQANTIAAGQYDCEIKEVAKHDQLGQALSDMTVALREAMVQNAAQNWIKTGQMQLNDQIVGEQDLIELSRHIIHFLVTYIEAPMGLFYIANETKRHLKLLASYGCQWRKNLAQEFQYGEGLVGQAALEQQPILITQPSNLEINVIFNETVTLNNMIAIPFWYKKTLKGVIELGVTDPFTPIQLEFLNHVTTNIGIAIHAVQSHYQMQNLLEQTHIQTEELHAQAHELQTQQEELLHQISKGLNQNN